MPCNEDKHCPIEDMLVKTKPRKSHKKAKECIVECCVSDCNPDCCTPAFQRLDKLRNTWTMTNLGVPPNAVPIDNTNTVQLYNRAGEAITLPPSEITGNNDVAAYYFVNVMRYLINEECGKLDQVTGWHVDIQSGSLVMYQTLYELNLSPSVDRADLINTVSTSLTPVEAQQLRNFEPFWKLSLKAAERVQQNPKEEGNICEIHDKCGNRYLVAINRASGNVSVCDYTSEFSIVIVRLC